MSRKSITILKELKQDFEVDKELLNGFSVSDQEDLFTELDEEFQNIGKFGARPSVLKLTYIPFFDDVFVGTSFDFDGNVTSEQVERLTEFVSDKLFELKTCEIDLGDKKVTVVLDGEEKVEPIVDHISAPEGYLFLEDILTSPEEELAYNECMTADFMIDRLVKFCKKNKMRIDDESNGLALPIHQKLPAYDVVIVAEPALKYFEQYKLVENYLRGFEEGTEEHTLGVLMMLYPRFNDFMLDISKDAAEGKEVRQDIFEEEFNKAVRYIEKHFNLTVEF